MPLPPYSLTPLLLGIKKKKYILHSISLGTLHSLSHCVPQAHDLKDRKELHQAQQSKLHWGNVAVYKQKMSIETFPAIHSCKSRFAPVS